MERFSDDFMFQPSDEEFKKLKSQIVISSWGGLRRADLDDFTGARRCHAIRECSAVC
jgi:hypothetical protein